MGFMKKIKESVDNSAAAAGFGAQVQANQAANQAAAAQGMHTVQGGPGINPAAFGGPSTTPLAADDPLLQPVEGVSLEQYARIAKLAGNQGITDEAGVCALAASQGIPADVYQRVMGVWNQRMQQSMVVGQTFHRYWSAA
jgi:hypothetical protein